MSVPALLAQLEACVQEELGAQGRTIALLESQERALLAGSTEGLATCAEACRAELATVPARARRRAEVLAGLGAAWQVDGAALTLSSVVRRAGDAGRRLERQRDELRRAVAKVARSSRRLAAAARMHQALVAEVLDTLLEEGRRAGSPGGGLVDASA